MPNGRDEKHHPENTWFNCSHEPGAPLPACAVWMQSTQRSMTDMNGKMNTLLEQLPAISTRVSILEQINTDKAHAALKHNRRISTYALVISTLVGVGSLLVAALALWHQGGAPVPSP